MNKKIFLWVMLTFLISGCASYENPREFIQKHPTHKKHLRVSPRYRYLLYRRIPQEDSQYIQHNAFSPIVFYAINMIGIPYVWGGETPHRGFDCSGFIHYIYQRSEDIQLPRTAAELYHIGITVKKLRPGDLLFFHTDRHAFISHVGIYIGNRNFVHSPRTGSHVRIEKIDQPYWEKHFLGAKRIILVKRNSLQKSRLLGLNNYNIIRQTLHVHAHTAHTTRRRHR